jgi:hypothetical protein
MELALAAGWNQTREDWVRLIALEPAGCFGAELDGRLVATTTLLCYGRDLAWIGMVLTHRDYQRRGLARRLVQEALDLAGRQNIRSVKLDATDQGRPLYQALGFEDEQPVERWRRDEVSAAGPMPAISLDRAADLRAFGCDRSRFLDALPPGVHRPGTRAHYFGPYVAEDPNRAETEIREVAAAIRAPMFWDLFPAHPHAPRIASELGFAPVRRLVRMVRGERIVTDDTLVYAIGGFEAG